MISITKEDLLKFANDYANVGEGWLVMFNGCWEVVPKDKIWVEKVYDPNIDETTERFYLDAGGKKGNALDPKDVFCMRLIDDTDDGVGNMRGKSLPKFHMVSG